MMNETYWREFYSKPHLELTAPSPFALWAGQFLRNRRIVDLGCGTGRDTHYFRQQNPLAYGVDIYAPQQAGFFQMNLEDYLRADPEVEVVYCRFLFHAIEARMQKKILEWASRWGATLYVEARSTIDKPVKTDHKRRLIDGQSLVSSMIGEGWRLLRYDEGYGRAKFGAEDPHVVRIVAKGSGR